MQIVLLLLLLGLMIIYSYGLYYNINIFKNTDFTIIKNINTFIFNIIIPSINMMGYTILIILNSYCIYSLFA